MTRRVPILLPLALLTATLPTVAAVPDFAAAQPAREGDDPVPVAVTPADCRRLVEHRPEPGIAYRPGEDIYHRPVAPADLPGGARLDRPGGVTIDITLDLAKRFGIATPSGPTGGEATAGTVTVQGDRVFFNGRPLQAEDQALLAAACRRRER